MASVQTAVPIANGVIIGLTNTDLIAATTDAAKTVITYALLVNYSAVPVVVDLYTLLSGQAVANEFNKLPTLTLAPKERYLISEILGLSLDLGGSVIGIADTDVSVSFSATATKINP